MYQISANDATSPTARFRMSVLCPEWTTGACIGSRLAAGDVAFGYAIGTPVSFKDTTLGVRAWSPPV